jgi:hypothetical protein
MPETLKESRKEVETPAITVSSGVFYRETTMKLTPEIKGLIERCVKEQVNREFKELEKSQLKPISAYILKRSFIIFPILTGFFACFSLVSFLLGDIKIGIAALGPTLAALVFTIAFSIEGSKF